VTILRSPPASTRLPRDAKIEGRLQYETAGTDGASEFGGVTESSEHIANECRVAFWADSIYEVDRLAAIVVLAGGKNVEGPAFEDAHYYTGLCVERSPGRSLAHPFFHFLPMVRRVPGYRQNTIVS
jgi:hypothetical protein